ncbi:MAG: hypothetical protein EON55_01020 [Alphaproteobacteria bacterium]|nr:MAG: hypothetical protein EON55_01020 [Alphaproteobacteria bacterium]
MKNAQSFYGERATPLCKEVLGHHRHYATKCPPACRRYRLSFPKRSTERSFSGYQYPGAAVANTTEAYFGLGYGPFSAKYSHTLTDGYFGAGKATSDGKGTGYFSFGYAQEVMPKLTLKASVGFTSFKSDLNNAGVPDYTDFSIGAAYDLGNGFSLSGMVQGANKKDSYVYSIDPAKSVNKNTLIVMITKAM